MESFTLAAPFRCDRVECLRREGSLSGQILGWSVSALPDFSGFPFDCGLLTRITVCSLPFMLIYHPYLLTYLLTPWCRVLLEKLQPWTGSLPLL